MLNGYDREYASIRTSGRIGLAKAGMPHDFALSHSFYSKTHRAGDIAQLARAAALQAVGRGFESHYLHVSCDSATWALTE